MISFAAVSSDIKRTVFFEIAPVCVAKNSADKGSAMEVLKAWYEKDNQTVFNEVTKFNCSSNVKISNNCAKEMTDFAMDADNYNLMLRYYENVANTEIRAPLSNPPWHTPIFKRENTSESQ